MLSLSQFEIVSGFLAGKMILLPLASMPSISLRIVFKIDIIASVCGMEVVVFLEGLFRCQKNQENYAAYNNYYASNLIYSPFFLLLLWHMSDILFIGHLGYCGWR